MNQLPRCRSARVRSVILVVPFCFFTLLIAGGVSAQDRPSPSTVSDEAAEIIRSVNPGDENATSTAKWQALWDENQAAIQPAVDAARELYPATIEIVSIAGYDHLLITPST